MGVFGSNFGHAVTQNLPVLPASQVKAVNNNVSATNDNIAAFQLDAGPPTFVFPDRARQRSLAAERACW